MTETQEKFLEATCVLLGKDVSSFEAENIQPISDHTFLYRKNQYALVSHANWCNVNSKKSLLYTVVCVQLGTESCVLLLYYYSTYIFVLYGPLPVNSVE